MELTADFIICLTMKNRLPGFTLIELMQVLILVALLITVLGGSLLYFTRYHTQVTERITADEDADMLAYALESDAFRFKTFVYTENQVLFTGPSDSVVYTFDLETVTRNVGAKADTFHLSATFREGFQSSIVFEIRNKQSWNRLVLENPTEGIDLFMVTEQE